MENEALSWYFKKEIQFENIYPIHERKENFAKNMQNFASKNLGIALIVRRWIQCIRMGKKNVSESMYQRISRPGP